MQYFDPEARKALKDAVDKIVLNWSGVTTKTMFGCPSYLADGTLFAVLGNEGVALTRLPSEQRKQVEKLFETSPFTAEKQTVKKWVQVAVESPSDLDALSPYLKASYEAARKESDGT